MWAFIIILLYLPEPLFEIVEGKGFSFESVNIDKKLAIYFFIHHVIINHYFI